MSDPNMDAADHPLDLSRMPSNFITMMLQRLSLSDRFTCALVCKAWAQEAAAATRSIILRDEVQDLSSLQAWVEKHGGQLEVLQLHLCPYPAALTALPCPQLHDLLLGGRLSRGLSGDSYLRLDSTVWSDIAAATKLTSVSLEYVQTASWQADVVSALTALPDLEQLTWRSVKCGDVHSWQQHLQYGLFDSKLLQMLTKLTTLRLDYVKAAAALQHLGLLTRLQDLSLDVTHDWDAAGCPGLQELKALTRLTVISDVSGILPSVSQLTALQQLAVLSATPTALTQLSALTALTQFRVEYLVDLLPNSPPLQLPGLKNLMMHGLDGIMHMSFLACCTQLQVLKPCDIMDSRRDGSCGANLGYSI